MSERGIVSASADCGATVAIACEKILSPEGLQAWWIGGKPKILDCDAAWPSLGTTLRWRAGGGSFSAQVTEDSRPERVVAEVKTPTANSVITHSFDPLPDGGTRYTKRVEPILRSRLSRALHRPLVAALRWFVPREVARAAAFADSSSSSESDA